MTFNIYSTSLVFLAGFCLFSAVYHFTTRQPGQQRCVHLLFAAIAFLWVLVSLTSVAKFNTPTLADHIAWERINLSFNILVFALLPWFFALYSGVDAKPVLVAGSALCVLLFFINLIQPNTLLYSEIQGINRLLLPWGEEVFLFKATPGIWSLIASSYLLLVPAFGLYTLILCFLRERNRSTLSMMLGTLLLLAALIQAVIVRVAGIHDYPPLGTYGYLGMVIVMGITLTHELREDRKKADEKLRLSERKTRAILDQGFVFIGLVSLDGILLDANRSSLNLVGMSPQDVLNKPFWESPWWNHSIELQNKLRESIKRAASGEDVHFEASHPEMNGNLRYVDFSLRPVKNEQGDIIYLIPEGHDITERKLIEEELRKSEERFKTITETSPIGIWEISQDRRTLYVNPATKSLLEVDSETDLMDKEIDSFFTLESLEVMKAEHTKRERGLQSSYELELIGSRGGRRNVVVSGAPLHSEEGKLTSLIGWFTDITERKQMENRLQIERNNFEVAFESNPIAVLIIDESNSILRANAAAMDLTGGDASQVMHHRPGDAFHCAHSFEAGCGNGTDCPLCPLRREIETLIAGTGGPIDKAETQLSVIRENKEQTLWLEVSATEMLLDSQRAFIVLLNDITERKKTETEIKLQYSKLEALNDMLAKTNKDLFDSETRLGKSLNEKEILIREVYHRTKNTMQVIRGILVLQSLDFPSNSELQQLVKNTEDRIQAISLVHQMLYQSNDLSQISIKEYIQNLIALLIQSYNYSDDRIACNITVDDHKFLLDTAIPLGLVINELTTNSLKYAFPNGVNGIININLTKLESGYYSLTFSDNGVGVPDGFDFRNYDSLGLKLIYSIGEDQMSGKVIMENNNGIRCSLEFPVNLYKARV